MHVGLNLVYLVPGETGGMEIVARELLPALLEAAARPALHRVRQPRGRRGRAARGTSWCPRCACPYAPGNRAEWVRGEQQLLPRLAARAGVDVLHSLGQHRARLGPLPARRRRSTT